jgi:exosortase N
VMSLLSALLIMNYYQRQDQRRLSTVVIAALLTLSIILNILANGLRIVCLVVFLILPENPFHGILGLLVLGVYVLLPLLPMIRYAIHRFGHPVLPANGSPTTVRSRWVLAGNILLLTGMLPLTALTLLNKDPQQHAFNNRTIPGYTLRERSNGITQLDNSRSMVYIKPIPGFYYTDHTPSICWEGSGYSFTTLRVSTIANLPLFEGVLEKGKEKLYTAWWYDDGARQTINPFIWRWDYFRGRGHYAVVNVTTASQPQLEAEVTRILKTHPFLPLLCYN